ncbi:uncharacterized protein LOC133860174 [Alnus glutinosa]|uniref:uncharacterized protein LOC133860174 n=1 Tax=Alnus glutinosa TaxID=3517 RepID=UPI002D782B8D|nr:uncharacterized protein LOC133860174 [Alnus glutinosa]
MVRRLWVFLWALLFLRFCVVWTPICIVFQELVKSICNSMDVIFSGKSPRADANSSSALMHEGSTDRCSVYSLARLKMKRKCMDGDGQLKQHMIYGWWKEPSG